MAGEPEVPLEKLQAEATVSLSSDRKMWFWQSVEAMTAQQRSKLLRFVTGRSRLVPSRRLRAANALSCGGATCQRLR